MKTTTKVWCLLVLVAFSIALILLVSWKKQFYLEYPIPEHIDLTYGEIYMLNLVSNYYRDNPEARIYYSEQQKCYLKRLKEKGYINEQNNIKDPTLLDNIPDQTKYVGMVFGYGVIMIDDISFAYSWGDDLTKRGFYTSSYYYGGGPPGRKIYHRTFKAKLAEFAFDVC